MAKTRKSRGNTKMNRLVFWIGLAVLAFRIIGGPEMVILLGDRLTNILTVGAIVGLVLVWLSGKKSIFTFVGDFLGRVKNFLLPDEEDEEDEEPESARTPNSVVIPRTRRYQQVVEEEASEPSYQEEQESSTTRRRRRPVREEQHQAESVQSTVMQQLPPKPNCPEGYKALWDPDMGTWDVVRDTKAVKEAPGAGQVVEVDATVS